MRPLGTFAALLLLAACGRSDPAQNPTGQTAAAATVSNWSAGRDRLCLKDERAGLIVYAATGDTNCMVRGAAESGQGMVRIRPDGDSSCVIEARTEGSALTFGNLSPSCAYYCGPKASYAGKRLEQTDNAPAVDLAGAPLC